MAAEISKSMQSPPSKLLIVRLSAIGDVVMTTGLLNPLKAAYPNCEISWLIDESIADLLSENPSVHLIKWPKRHWQQLWRNRHWSRLFKEVKAFRRSLKDAKFDWVIDAQGLLKSAFLARFTSANRRIGFAGKEGNNYLMTEVLEREQGKQIGSEYRGLLSYLGLDPQHYRMELPSAVETQSHTAALRARLFAASNYICLAPFTTRAQKHWPHSYWLQLLAWLNQHNGWPCLILGGPGDRDLAEQLTRQQANTYHLCGHTNLLQSSELIRTCRLLVGVDTGLTHMAVAHGVPLVALFGSTRPYLQTYQDNARILYDNRSCSPCRRHPVCDGRFDCMHELTPHRVSVVIEELLDESSAS